MSPNKIILLPPGEAKSKKRREKEPLVESEVRRSERLLHTNKGFKKKTCQDANCMACLAQPPACNSEVIKNLNISYCKVDAKNSTEEILQKKKVKKGGKQPAWKD